MEKANIIHVYMMPGMAANTSIFDFITLGNLFEIHRLDWLTPNKNETLTSYAMRMCEKVTHPNPVLVGVSFGGVLVQEMSKLISCRNVIIVSSVRSHKEFPIHMRITRKTKAYRFFPTQWVDNLEDFVGFMFGPATRNRKDLDQKYRSVRLPGYLGCALESVFH